MIGLQEMLMQTDDKKIYLLPAWPKDWDVDFKLHAPYNTVIEGKVRNGQIEEMNVTLKARQADVIICEQWFDCAHHPELVEGKVLKVILDSERCLCETLWNGHWRQKRKTRRIQKTARCGMARCPEYDQEMQY